MNAGSKPRLLRVSAAAVLLGSVLSATAACGDDALGTARVLTLPREAAS